MVHTSVKLVNFLYILGLAVSNPVDYKEKIVGGSKASISDYPYQISIHYIKAAQHICSGSIIDNEWILTAAHCVDGTSATDLKVIAGSDKLSSGGTSFNVTKIIMHEDYDSFYAKNDVAVLRIVPLNYTKNISRIILETRDVDDEEECTLSGWGMLEYPGPVSDNLQHINLTTTTKDVCEEIMNPVDDSQICTFTKEGEGGCRFDSGGALVWANDGAVKQIGIVSWMILCARGYPDVYSRVSYYIDWINENCDECI